MKKTIIIFLLAALGGVLFAQATVPSAATVSGTLGISAGHIAVRSGDTTYYTMGLDRFVGFIDGLKEGAQVTMEGYVSSPYFEGQPEIYFFPVKLTLNGRVYDLAPEASYRGNAYPYAPGGYGRGGMGMGGRGGMRMGGYRGGGRHCW